VAAEAATRNSRRESFFMAEKIVADEAVNAPVAQALPVNGNRAISE
jgi:hypothetical protein